MASTQEIATPNRPSVGLVNGPAALEARWSPEGSADGSHQHPTTWIESRMISWIGVVQRGLRWLGGIFAVGFLVAWLATVPLVQVVTLGFFVEVTRRVARGGRLRDGWPGAEKGWWVCKLLLGLALTWLPLMIVSRLRYDAWLIEPDSVLHGRLRIAEWTILGLTLVHWVGVGLAGGRLRHFLWPVLLPWYGLTGLLKRFLSIGWIRSIIGQTLGTWFPRSVAAYYHSPPLSDWFVPALLYRHLRQGTLLSAASDRFWAGVGALRPVYYFQLGLGALIGLMVWFAGPTLWLLIATRTDNEVAEGLFYLLGVVHLFLVLQYFPLVHCQYCLTGRWSSYLRWRQAASRYWYSPFRVTLAMAVSLLLTAPLWLTRIAMIPYDLWWMLAGLYVLCLWPIWLAWGWAWHHASHRPATPSKWWSCSWMPIFWALVLGQTVLSLVSIYLAWQGVFNLLLHPTFHIPTPFGIGA